MRDVAPLGLRPQSEPMKAPIYSNDSVADARFLKTLQSHQLQLSLAHHCPGARAVPRDVGAIRVGAPCCGEMFLGV